MLCPCRHQGVARVASGECNVLRTRGCRMRRRFLRGRPMFADRLATLALIVLFGYLIARACRRWPDRERRWLGRALAFTLVAYATVTYIKMGLAGELSVTYALPLELCHWVMIACVVALLRPSRYASEVAYYWGLAGTSQAAITPDISRGFPSWESGTDTSMTSAFCSPGAGRYWGERLNCCTWIPGTSGNPGVRKKTP